MAEQIRDIRTIAGQIKSNQIVMVPALTINQNTRECEIENADAIYDTGPILFYFLFFYIRLLWVFFFFSARTPLPLSATAGWSLSPPALLRW